MRSSDGRLVLVHDHDVEVAIVIEIPKSAASADVPGADRRPRFVADPGKGSIAPIAEQHAGPFVGEFWVDFLHFRVNVSRYPEDVRVAVIIEVERHVPQLT